jgi:rhodanese-related sulfurtransferase
MCSSLVRMCACAEERASISLVVSSSRLSPLGARLYIALIRPADTPEYRSVVQSGAMAEPAPAPAPIPRRGKAALSYIPSSLLHTRLLDPTHAARTLVVDVRDSDFVGGHVTSALNVPSKQFRDRLDELYAAAAGKDLVVFHCMHSQQRGPRCARIMGESIDARTLADIDSGVALADSTAAAFPSIVVLTGGFDGWAQYVSKLDAFVRRKDAAALITAYDKNEYGYKI